MKYYDDSKSKAPFNSFEQQWAKKKTKKVSIVLFILIVCYYIYLYGKMFHYLLTK